MTDRPIRVLLAKPGLDGHDRGVKAVAMTLRDAGFEVIYLGLRRTSREIVTAALQEDVDVIGFSVLSGAHVPLSREILAELEAHGADIPVVVGGTIPDEDVPVLRELGIAGIFPVSTSLADVSDAIYAITSARRPG